jgi:HEAT repeat protein
MMGQRGVAPLCAFADDTSADAYARSTVINVLGAMGQRIDVQLPADRFIPWFTDEDEDVRGSALFAVQFARSPLSAEIITALTAQLNPATWSAFSTTAGTLTAFGPRAAAAVPRFKELVTDANPDVRAASAQALAAIGPESAISALAKALMMGGGDGDESQRIAARSAVMRAMAVLARTNYAALDDFPLTPGGDLKIDAAVWRECLAVIGPRAARPATIEALRPSLAPATITAADAKLLAALAEGAGPLVPEMIKAIGDPAALARDSALREELSIALAMTRDTRAHAYLSATARDDTQARFARIDAVRALTTAGIAAAPLCKELAVLADDPDKAIKRDVLALFAAAGPAGAAGFAGWESRPDAARRAQIVAAIGKTAAPDASTATLLLPGLRDADAAVVSATILALGRIGASAGGVAGDLAKHLTAPDAKRRDLAAWALGRMGPAAAGAAGVVDALTTAASSDADALVRHQAARALDKITS